MTVEFPSDPTRAEIARSGVLLNRHILPGKWFWLNYLLFIIIYVSVMVLAAGVAVLASDRFAVSLPVQLAIMIGIYSAFALGLHVLNRRRVQTHMDSALRGGMTTTLSTRGIAFDNGRSSGLTDWRDIDRLLEGKALTVACVGHVGYIISDRMLAQAGDPVELKAQIRRWYAEARAQ